MQQNEDLVRTANFNLNNVLINIDSTEGVEGSEEQGQIMYEHVQDIQGQEQAIILGTSTSMTINNNKDMVQTITQGGFYLW
ncbi:5643_t:CDS:2 [Dentiscutata erythropus]|uniref:5643_t:CDS:1 n=1 Tax=Dentiscutata erythropus TaxID=1348616 RepID=A0A9N9CED2_9GLOM|nr:5643_t:CDS:2 [Dentiscutata erythropus]